MEKHTTIAVDMSKAVFEIAIRSARACLRTQALDTQPDGCFLCTAVGGHRPAGGLRLGPPGLGRSTCPGHRVLLLPPHQTSRHVLRDKTDETAPTPPEALATSSSG